MSKLSASIIKCITCVLALHCNLVKAEESSHSSSYNRLTPEQTANLTHLKWSPIPPSKNSIQIQPIQNFSGIPLEHRTAEDDYFYHGKLPLIMNNLITDAFLASHRFIPVKKQADYKANIILQSYRLPYSFAPDNNWTETLYDDIGRWFEFEKTTVIRMTLQLVSGMRQIRTWNSSVEVSLSSCYLNRYPQPLTWMNNRDKTIRQYLLTPPGQAFLAATNHLLLAAIHRLNQQSQLATIEDKLGDEIQLYSPSINFTRGEKLQVYLEQPEGLSAHPAGAIQVIHAHNNYATAYPVSLRADHLKKGDKVSIGQLVSYENPKSKFVADRYCGEALMLTEN